jgi:energy-converting hydrogenase Eha subunit F
MLDKFQIRQPLKTPQQKIVVRSKVLSQLQKPRNIIKPHNQMLRALLNNKPLVVQQGLQQSVVIRRTQIAPQPKPQIQEKIQRPPHNKAVMRPYIYRANTPHQNVSLRPQIGKLTNVIDQKIMSLKDIGVGKILVIIAAGPSVNEVDFTRIKDHSLIDVMCINQPYVKLWPTKFWAFCDHTQYARNESIWNSYNGTIINSYNVKARKSNQILIKSMPGQGFSIDLVSGYHIGRSSTYAAIQVAKYMEYHSIYIYGCDMSAGKDGSLWHYGTNPDVSSDNRKKRFEAEAVHYMWAAQHLPVEVRNKFIFCSSLNPWPFIQHFPHLDHLSAIDEVLKQTDLLKAKLL